MIYRTYGESKWFHIISNEYIYIYDISVGWGGMKADGVCVVDGRNVVVDGMAAPVLIFLGSSNDQISPSNA